MEQKIENEDKKKSKKRRILLWAFLLFFFFLIFWFLFSRNGLLGRFIFGSREVEQSEIVNENQEEEFSDQDFENTADENNEDVATEEEMISENYRVTQVRFGNNVVIENGRSREANLEIYQVKSENTISQEDDTPRIIISWRTNKEAISTVSYAKIDGKGAVNVNEEGYGFEHSMLLKNMEFSTIYTYKIEAKDKWGNKTSTEYFSAYTGDKSESIFDLITNAVEDVFGWAMK
ncbi:MAG: fibronectin type III domain-containing protein [Candidatus Moraniibacteriota bacterium]